MSLKSSHCPKMAARTPANRSHSSHEEREKVRRKACFLPLGTTPESCHTMLAYIPSVTGSHQLTKQAGKYGLWNWQQYDLKIKNLIILKWVCSTSAQWHSETDEMSVGSSWSVTCWMFSGIPDLYLLVPFLWWWAKRPSSFARCPLRDKNHIFPLWRRTRHLFHLCLTCL